MLLWACGGQPEAAADPQQERIAQDAVPVEPIAAKPALATVDAALALSARFEAEGGDWPAAEALRIAATLEAEAAAAGGEDPPRRSTLDPLSEAGLEAALRRSLAYTLRQMTAYHAAEVEAADDP